MEFSNLFFRLPVVTLTNKLSTKLVIFIIFFASNFISKSCLAQRTILNFNSNNNQLTTPPNLEQKRRLISDQKPENLNSLPLSPGDKIKILVRGEGGEIFNGDYEVNLYGNIELPYLDSISVGGLDSNEVKQKLRAIFLEKQFFKPELLEISVQVLSFGAIQVSVSGDVFEPGRIVINDSENNAPISSDDIPGDNPLDRYLTQALKSVGGVKPTADLTKIEIFRQGKLYKIVDISGVLSGNLFEDVPLIDEDQIIVPSTKVFQTNLVRPSPITPEEIPLYVANLSEPSGGRALEGASRISETRFDYGTRLAQILISAQCLGGDFIQRNRYALLVRTNPVTKEVTTLNQLVEDIVTNPNLQEEINPFLMPNDGVACYDSKLTNTTNFFQFLNTVLSPFNTLSNILNNFDNFFRNNNFNNNNFNRR